NHENRIVETVFFLFRKLPIRAFRKISERQRTDADAHQAEYPDSESFKHSSNLPVLTFFQHDFDPTVALALTQNLCRLRSQRLAPAANTNQQRSDNCWRHRCPDLNVINLFNVAGWIGDSRCPF